MHAFTSFAPERQIKVAAKSHRDAVSLWLRCWWKYNTHQTRRDRRQLIWSRRSWTSGHTADSTVFNRRRHTVINTVWRVNFPGCPRDSCFPGKRSRVRHVVLVVLRVSECRNGVFCLALTCYFSPVLSMKLESRFGPTEAGRLEPFDWTVISCFDFTTPHNGGFSASEETNEAEAKMQSLATDTV